MQESGRTEIIPFICISAFLVQYLLFSTSWAPLGLTLGRGYSFLAYWLCRPLLLLPPIPPSIRVFSNQSTLRMRWPKYWVSASASFPPKKSQGWSPSEWSDCISFQSKGLSRVFSNTAVHTSILWHSAFFTVQLSHPHMTTGKTVALTRRTFVGKVMPLLFNTLSRLVITFLLLYLLHQSIWLHVSQHTVENSQRDGNTRPPYLPPVWIVCRLRNKS